MTIAKRPGGALRYGRSVLLRLRYWAVSDRRLGRWAYVMTMADMAAHVTSSTTKKTGPVSSWLWSWCPPYGGPGWIEPWVGPIYYGRGCITTTMAWCPRGPITGAAGGGGPGRFITSTWFSYCWYPLPTISVYRSRHTDEPTRRSVALHEPDEWMMRASIPLNSRGHLELRPIGSANARPQPAS